MGANLSRKLEMDQVRDEGAAGFEVRPVQKKGFSDPPEQSLTRISVTTAACVLGLPPARHRLHFADGNQESQGSSCSRPHDGTEPGAVRAVFYGCSPL